MAIVRPRVTLEDSDRFGLKLLKTKDKTFAVLAPAKRNGEQ
jgi:hypothetical protein